MDRSRKAVPSHDPEGLAGAALTQATRDYYLNLESIVSLSVKDQCALIRAPGHRRASPTPTDNRPRTHRATAASPPLPPQDTSCRPATAPSPQPSARCVHTFSRFRPTFILQVPAGAVSGPSRAYRADPAGSDDTRDSRYSPRNGPHDPCAAASACRRRGMDAATRWQVAGPDRHRLGPE